MSKRTMHHSHHNFMGGHKEKGPVAHKHSSQMVPPMGDDTIVSGGSLGASPMPQGGEDDGADGMPEPDGDEEPAGVVPVSDFKDRPTNKRNKP